MPAGINVEHELNLFKVSGEHCIKYRNFLLLKFCQNAKMISISGDSPETLRKIYAFPQCFHTRKLGQISTLYAVENTKQYINDKSIETMLNRSTLFQSFFVDETYFHLLGIASAN